MRYASLIPALCLAGCAAFDTATLATLDRLDPLTADPAEIAIRIDLPEGLDIAPGSARLTLGAIAPEQIVKEDFVLQEAGSAYRVAPNDLARLRRLQSSIAALKEVDPEGTEGELSLTFGPCRRGAGPDPRAELSAEILLDAEPRPLVGPVSVRQFQRALGLAELAPCPEAPSP